MRLLSLAQSVKNQLAMPETRVPVLGREDPLEKETTTHSSIFAWRIPWTEDPGRIQSMGSQDLDTTKYLNHHPLVCGLLHSRTVLQLCNNPPSPTSIQSGIQ